MPADVPPAVADLLPYFQSRGQTAPALEFLSPVKGPSLEQITVEVGSGIRTAADGAALYDEDVRSRPAARPARLVDDSPCRRCRARPARAEAGSQRSVTWPIRPSADHGERIRDRAGRNRRGVLPDLVLPAGGDHLRRAVPAADASRRCLFSLTRWTLFDCEFIGLDNFAQFFREPFLVKGLVNTLIYARRDLGAEGRARPAARLSC